MDINPSKGYEPKQDRHFSLNQDRPSCLFLMKDVDRQICLSYLKHPGPDVPARTPV